MIFIPQLNGQKVITVREGSTTEKSETLDIVQTEDRGARDISLP